MKKEIFLLLAATLLIFLVSCGEDEEKTDAPDTGDNQTSTEEESNSEEIEEDSETENITADIMNGDGDEVGTAELIEQEDGVYMHLEASDLPEGEHGFHIHESGLCEGPDFESAGDHFNPSDSSHGTESEDGPHAGDLPNIEVSEDGTVEQEVTAENVTLTSGEDHSLLDEDGTALVIHAEADDHESQPAGDAGARIACGIISDED
ncbi:superoxide dismutase family protein [Halobacillus sp. A5]|uniref:superoxide dismutase family protein n=1 Tax=Halobacillus sp. A5 TaxID=2880263 RepID=UPI0020A66B62|nr:superoxide dismutase family protein [Halobacillus sp. A5]MCP3028394.1 superoxide dismutase family protein [Halobacillus sp. A5]